MFSKTKISEFISILPWLIVFMTMPAIAMGAQSVDSRALNHFEDSLIVSETPASKDEGAIEGFFRNTKNNLLSNAVARGEVLRDLDMWIDIKPLDDLTAKARMIRADIFRQINREPEALLDWLTVKKVFPSSRYASKASTLVGEVVEKKRYKRDHDAIKSILNRKAKGKASYRHARLLKSMSSLKYEGFREPLAHAYQIFLVNYRSHELAPMVQMLLADNRAMENTKTAVYQYKTLIALYPRSSYVANALVAVADINQLRLNKPKEAISGYQQVVKNYPKRATARWAYLNMATTYERHLRDDVKAIDTLKKLVHKYPRTKEASKGNEALARLYEKSKQYEAAINANRNMVKISRDTEAIVTSLEKAAFIAESKLDNYQLMIEINHQLCSNYPVHNACAKARYRNGQAYEKQFHDKKKATSEYQKVIAKFPDHRLAKKASVRVKSIQKGGSGLSLF